MAWTPDRVALLKKLWAEGLSASAIARSMGGVTRNAVIGKVTRMGLDGRVTTGRANRPRRASLPRPKPKPVLVASADVPEAVVADGARVTVLTLKDSMCRWPIGEPRTPDFHFCGNMVEGGQVYCAAHAALAYVAPKRHVSNSDFAPYKTKRARFT